MIGKQSSRGQNLFTDVFIVFIARIIFKGVEQAALFRTDARKSDGLPMEFIPAEAGNGHS